MKPAFDLLSFEALNLLHIHSISKQVFARRTLGNFRSNVCSVGTSVTCTNFPAHHPQQNFTEATRRKPHENQDGYHSHACQHYLCCLTMSKLPLPALYIWNDEPIILVTLPQAISQSLADPHVHSRPDCVVFTSILINASATHKNRKILACMPLPAISCHGKKPNLANEQEFIMPQFHGQNPSIAAKTRLGGKRKKTSIPTLSPCLGTLAKKIMEYGLCFR